MKHTPEPWHACSANDGKCICQGVIATDGTTIAHFYGDDDCGIEGVTEQCPNVEEGHANRHRAAACVNACAGIPDPADLRRQRDELLAACHGAMLGITEHQGGMHTIGRNAVDILREAIAACEVKP